MHYPAQSGTFPPRISTSEHICITPLDVSHNNWSVQLEHVKFAGSLISLASTLFVLLPHGNFPPVDTFAELSVG